jgi:hypothetical protein
LTVFSWVLFSCLAFSDPYVSSAGGVIWLLWALAVLLIFFWALVELVHPMSRYSELRGTSLLLLLITAVSIIAVDFLYESNAPKTLRFELSRSSLVSIVQQPRQLASYSGPKRLGLYRVSEVRFYKGCTIFKTNDGLLVDEAGIAFCPDGPPKESSTSADGFEQIEGQWWFWSSDSGEFG